MNWVQLFRTSTTEMWRSWILAFKQGGPATAPAKKAVGAGVMVRNGAQPLPRCPHRIPGAPLQRSSPPRHPPPTAPIHPALERPRPPHPPRQPPARLPLASRPALPRSTAAPPPLPRRSPRPLRHGAHEYPQGWTLSPSAADTNVHRHRSHVSKPPPPKARGGKTARAQRPSLGRPRARRPRRARDCGGHCHFERWAQANTNWCLQIKSMRFCGSTSNDRA